MYHLITKKLTFKPLKIELNLEYQHEIEQLNEIFTHAKNSGIIKIDEFLDLTETIDELSKENKND